MPSHPVVRTFVGLASLGCTLATAQLAGLPASKLLTVLPMGGQAGATLDVTITGTDLDEPSELRFSSPRITAKAKTGENGKPEQNKFIVSIAADTPLGLHEVRAVTRLGISTPRAFVVGSQTEITRAKANNSAETALELPLNSVCNAAVTPAAEDFYFFRAKKGQKFVIDCTSTAIDSKLNRVLIIADESGRDLAVSRRGGSVDFVAPEEGNYRIKVHSLTFEGGPEHFYRLALLDKAPAQLTKARSVSSFSWTQTDAAPAAEKDPNDKGSEAQKVTLPCDISGKFFPAADVDTFEFEAKKGEVWWIELASHRLGLSTDPFGVVQRVTQDKTGEKLTDVAELNDIANPAVGTPYDAGSSDILGKIEIKDDGTYRLQLRDLFGGTRNQEGNVYRLIIRKAAPDFALVAWAFDAPNGPNYAQAPAKPLALRGGGTLAFQVAVQRRDGFDGEIHLSANGLPAGVTATGLKIPAGKSTGLVLLSAAENAARSLALINLSGKAKVGNAEVTRTCQIASVVWPVLNTAQEIPRARLHADLPVSVCGFETSPLTISPKETKTYEAKVAEKLTIPLKLIWRGEANSAIKLKAVGAGFEAMKEIDVALKAAASDVLVDLAALKTPVGAHTLAFHTIAKGKYRREPEALKKAEAAQKQADQAAVVAAAEVKKLSEAAKSAPADKKPAADAAAKTAVENQKAADLAKADAAKLVKEITAKSQPKDYAEIVFSEPIQILVKEAEKK